MSETFLRVARWVLLITGVAKLVAGLLGKSKALLFDDPLLGVSFRSLIIFVGIVELIIAIVTFLSHDTILRLRLVAWTSTSIALYRVGLHIMGYSGPCKCLGTLTDALHIPPSVADFAMQVVLMGLLLGSYIFLWTHRVARNIPGTTGFSNPPCI